MRREAEPSISLQNYFGKCVKAGYRLPLRYLAMQNFYGANDGQLIAAFDPTLLKECHFIDVFGGHQGAASNVFIDDTWRDIPDDMHGKWTIHRTNELAEQHVKILQSFHGLEELYFVGNGAQGPALAENECVSPKSSVSASTPRPSLNVDHVGLGRSYLHAITINHGATLKILLLSDQCGVEPEEMASLVRCCPNLAQLGLALSGTTHEIFGFLVPFLPKLYALRVLANAWLTQSLEEHRLKQTWEEQLDDMGRMIYKSGPSTLRWVGVGHEILRVGSPNHYKYENGTSEWGNKVHPATLQEVSHLRVWGWDNHEI